MDKINNIDKLLLSIHSKKDAIEVAKKISKITGKTVKWSTVYHRRRKILDRISGSIDSMHEEIAPKFLDYLKLTGDAIISSDWHIPFYSKIWAEKIIQYAKKYEIRTHIIAGDYFDQYMYSVFDKKHPFNNEKELELAEKICDKNETVFDKIYLVTGNHEERFFKSNKYQINQNRFLRMMGRDLNKYVYSPYHYLILDNWRITHPGAYRQTKLSIASSLADKFRMNVLQAHAHFGSIGYSKSGYLIGDLGGIFDKERMEYIMEKDSTNPVWNNGFFIYYKKHMIPILEGWEIEEEI